MAATLQGFLDAINVGDYASAMSFLAPNLRANRSQWRHDYATTSDSALTILSYTHAGSIAHVWASFTSRQSRGYGPSDNPDATCVTWSIDYTLEAGVSGWTITAAKGHGTHPYTRC